MEFCFPFQNNSGRETSKISLLAHTCVSAHTHTNGKKNHIKLLTLVILGKIMTFKIWLIKPEILLFEI